MESMFETSFVQGYLETNLILFPCENAGVHWHIYDQQDEGCFDPFLFFCKSSRNVTLGHHLCLAFAVSSCQRFKWHNPKQLLIAFCVMSTAGPSMPSVRASPVLGWWERLLGVGCRGIQSGKTIDMLA